MAELMDFVHQAKPLLKDRDKNAWDLGDIVVLAIQTCNLEVKAGRPKNGSNQPTLGDFAAMLNQSTPRVSEWWKVAAMYPDEWRPHNARAFEHLTWAHYNLARRKSGGELMNALELLDTAVRLHLDYNPFKRWLNGELWEGYLEYQQLPTIVQPFARPDQRVWAVFKYQQDEMA